MTWRDRLHGRKRILPQWELGPRLGGLKVLLQRGGFLMQMITMGSAMISAWATSRTLRSVFLDSVALYFASTALLIAVWLVVYYSVILPSEQTFNQTQSQRPERSPLKRDTEQILDRLEAVEQRQQMRADGGTEDNK